MLWCATHLCQLSAVGFPLVIPDTISDTLCPIAMHYNAPLDSQYSPEQHGDSDATPQLSYDEEQAEGPVHTHASQAHQACAGEGFRVQ